MSKINKLLKKIENRARDLTYSELKKILSALGYVEDNRGQTSGSRVAFINIDIKHAIRLHKPHPGNVLKQYQVKQIQRELKDKGFI